MPAPSPPAPSSSTRDRCTASWMLALVPPRHIPPPVACWWPGPLRATSTDDLGQAAVRHVLLGRFDLLDLRDRDHHGKSPPLDFPVIMPHGSNRCSGMSKCPDRDLGRATRGPGPATAPPPPGCPAPDTARAAPPATRPPPGSAA